MYQEKLVVAVKHNGRVLRESGDTVFMPFGAEYTLHFKNLNSVRALVRVSVDGVDATKGTSLIVPANGTVDLERFLIAGQMDKGHKFKFIERTQKIEDGPRGIQAEDGLIRVEFEFEREPAKIVNTIREEIVKRTYVEDYWHRTYPRWPEVWCSTGVLRGASMGNLQNAVQSSTTFAQNASAAPATSFTATSGEGMTLNAAASAGPTQAFVNQVNASYDPTSVQEDFYFPQAAGGQSKVEAVAGITVPGSISEQKFNVGQWFPTDGQKHVMVLKIMGKIGETVVEAPVTVKTKVTCPTCGTENKFGTKFCAECGTSLVVL
jgi:hypothetical protein